MSDQLADLKQELNRLEQELDEIWQSHSATRKQLDCVRKLEMIAVAIASGGVLFSVMVLMLKIVR